MTAIFLDCHVAVRVVLHQDSVCVRHALIVLIHVRVLVLFALVCGHESYLLLLVAWENSKITLRDSELVKIGD